MSSKIQPFINARDPKALTYDPQAEDLVRAPSHIDPHDDQPIENETRQSPFVKMIPKLNIEKTHTTCSGLEIINSQYNVLTFISEQSLVHGVYYIELIHLMNFKQVKVGIVKTSKTGAKREYSMNLDKAKNCNSLILKIDMDHHKMTMLLSSVNYYRELKFKGSNFKLFITLSNVGNFISLNPFYLHKGVSNLWRFHWHLIETKKFNMLKNWQFITDFNKDALANKDTFFEEEIKVGSNVGAKITNHVYDGELQILAIEIGKHSHKALIQNNPSLQFVPKMKIKEALTLLNKDHCHNLNDSFSKLVDFLQINYNKLTAKSPIADLENYLPKLKSLIPQTIATDVESANQSFTMKYLESSDCLLVSNNVNKLKVLKQRSSEGSFIVSPFIFDTQRINVNLLLEEFQLIFKSLNWTDLLHKLSFGPEEVDQMKELFLELTNDNSILCDHHSVYMALTSPSMRTLVEKLLEYVSVCLKSSAQTLCDREDDVILETVNEDGGEIEPKAITAIDDDHGLTELFQEPLDYNVNNVRKGSSKAYAQNLFKNNFDIFPNEFDGLLKAIYKLEEALYVQDHIYSKKFSAASRSHTGYNRLFSYISSALSLKHIEQLIDCGIFINSTFLQEFKNFKFEEFAYNDFNDQNIAPSLLKAYREGKVNPYLSVPPSENVELDFSISHMPPVTFSQNFEKVFSPQNGKFVFVITRDKSAEIFSTKYGLCKLATISLEKTLPWTNKKLFDNLMPITLEGTEYFTKDYMIELAKKAEDPKPQATVQEEPTENVNKGMLDQLYQMGFSIQLGTKALAEVKSSSLDAALNVIFKLKEQEPKVIPAKNKIFQLVLKPEWQCRVCTLINYVANNPSNPSVCEACGNIADEDAYFEEVQEVGEANNEVVKVAEEEAAKAVWIKSSDEIIDLEVVELDKENLLHYLFIVFVVRRGNELRAGVSRLAFNDELIKNIVTIDPKSGNIMSIFGQNLLKKGRKEKDLGEILHSLYIDKILNIAPRLSEKAVFIESAREMFRLEGFAEVTQVFAVKDGYMNERNSESKNVIFVGNNELQEWVLVNQAKSYSQSDFSFTKALSKPLTSAAKLVRSRDEVNLLITLESMLTFKTSVNDIKELQRNATEMKRESFAILNSNQILSIAPGGKAEIIALKSLLEQNEFRTLDNYLENLGSTMKSKQTTGIVNPKIMLSYFKTQTHFKFSVKDQKNLLTLSKSRPKERFEYYMQPIDFSTNSSFTVVTQSLNEGFNANIEAFYKVDRSNENARQFIAAQQVPSKKADSTPTNDFQKLHIKVVDFKGTHFSKNYHVSQMLVDNNEHFATQCINNLFIFENLFERRMKIKKFSFIIPDSFRQNSTMDEVLLFVFNDLSLANQFIRYKSLTYAQYENGLKQGLFPKGLEPCLCVSLKQTGNSEVSAELEIEKIGKYVAFLPLVCAKTSFNPNSPVLDCIQYFGVEGEYLSESEENEHLDDPTSIYKEDLSTQAFSKAQWKIQYGNRRMSIDNFRIQNLRETKNDCVVKVVTNVQLSGEPTNQVDFDIPARMDDLQLIGFSIRFLNISNLLCMEISDQFKKGSNEKFKQFLSLYNSQIIEANQANQLTSSSSSSDKKPDSLISADTETDLLALGELLLFSLETFGVPVADSIIQTINLQAMIQRTLLNSPNLKILSIYRVIFEKLINIQTMHLELVKVLSILINDLPSNLMNVDGLYSFWQLLYKFSAKAEPEIKAQLFKLVSSFFAKSLSMIKSNNTEQVKLLRTFDVQETINGLLRFDSRENAALKSSSDSKSAKAVIELTAEFASPENVIDYLSFILQEKNYYEVYINCQQVIKLDEIMFKLKGPQKLFNYTFDVYYWCPKSSRFRLMKSKRLTDDFGHYIISTSRKEAKQDILENFDFGLNFSAVDCAVKLIKIVVKINHLPIYEYTEPEALEISPYIFGKVISNLPANFKNDSFSEDELKKLTFDFSSQTNMHYLALFDELSQNNNLKPKIQEINSSDVYKVLKLEKRQPATTSPDKAVQDQLENDKELTNLFEDLWHQKDVLAEYLSKINLVDTTNKQKVISGISNIVGKYIKDLEAVEQSKKARSLANLNYDQNLTFWATNLDYMLREFFGTGSQEQIVETFKGVSEEALIEICFSMFYDVYLLKNSKYPKIEDSITVLTSQLSPDSLRRLAESICKRYLSESDIVFSLNLDTLIDKLKNTKLLSTFTWQGQLKAIHETYIPAFNKDPQDSAIFKQIYLANQILFAQLNEEKNILHESFEPMLAVLLWMLESHLPLVATGFNELAGLLVAKIFHLLQPREQEAVDISATTLQRLMYLMIDNGMTAILNKALNDFQKAVNPKAKTNVPAKPEVAKSILEKIHKTLIMLIREEIIDKENGGFAGEGKIQEVLYFALNLIRLINDKLYVNAREVETEKTPLISKSFSKKDSQHIINNSQLLTANKEADFIFNDFVSDILNFLNFKGIEDNSVISIITNFAINEHINQTVLLNFLKFVMGQSKDLRQTIISDLSTRFIDIFKKIRSSNNKTHLRDFATITFEMLGFLMTNYRKDLMNDIALVHFCIRIALQIINENEPKVVADEACKIPLKPQVVVPLLCESLNLLVTNFNFGGFENFQFFHQDKLNLFEFVAYCVHIIVKGVDESNASLLNHLIQNFKSLKDNSAEHDLTKALDELCIWLLCNVNSASPDMKSIVGPIFKKLYMDIDFLYFELMKKEECAKMLLYFTCSHFKSLYNTLHKKIKGESLGYIALYMAENSLDFMENLLKNVSKNEILATYFLNQTKGLEMIFDILNKCSSNETVAKKGPAIFSDGLIGKLHTLYTSATNQSANSDAPKLIHSTNKDKAAFEEEFGNRIKNIFVDKTITNGNNIKDWHVNKSGRNNSIYSTSIQANKKSIALRFKSSEPFELRNFKISLTVTRSENYIVVGPAPYIHLYAIIEDEQNPSSDPRRVYLGELERLEDTGYFLYNAMVYVLNPNRINGKDYIKSLNALHYIKEITDFEVVIARPLFTAVDKISPLALKSMTAVNLSINFISIDGFSHTKVDLLSSFQSKTQTVLHSFIDILFNSDSFTHPLDEYFDSLNKSGNTELFRMIERQMDPIMQNFNERMSKFLMILSEKNKQMADSIFMFLMKNILKKSLFFDLIEKILKRTYSYQYLFEFMEFGKKNLCNSAAELGQFLKVIVNYIVHVVNKLDEDGSHGKFALPIDQKFYRLVMNLHKTKPFVYSIERFLVIVITYLYDRRLYTEFPLDVVKKSSLEINQSKLTQDTHGFALQLMDQLLQAVLQNDFVFLPQLAYLALRCAEAKSKIVEKNIIKLALDNILMPNNTIRTEILLFINVLCDFDDLHLFILNNSGHSVLLTTLEGQLGSATFKADEELIHQLLKTIFKVYKVNAEKIEELEEILFALLKKYKNDSFFIEKIFLKFFEFEMTKAVCFKVVKRVGKDLLENKDGADSISLSLTSAGKKLQISSNIISSTYLNKLASKLVFLVDEKTDKEIRRHEWKRIIETNDSTEDFGPKFEATCYNKKPIFIIASTECNGVAGYLGLFAPEGFTESNDQPDYNAYIPNSDNVFIFYYTDECEVHYKPDLDNCPKFLQYSNNPDNKTIALLYDMSEKVLISMIADVQSNVDLSPMKPIAQDNNAEFEFPYDVHLNTIEIFQLDIKTDQKSSPATTDENEDLCAGYLNKNSIVDMPYSIYESSVVYDLPNELSLRALKDVANLLVYAEENKDKKLSDIEGKHIFLEVTKEVPPLNKKIFENNYNPKFPLFEAFISRGGMRYIIETIKQNDKITFLTQSNLLDVWKKVMDDLLDLEKIDGFLSSMIQNKEFLLMLFELFIGGSKSERNWQEAEFLVSSLTFEKLASILKNTDSIETRIVFFEKNVLRKLLDKLKYLTSETARVYDDAPEKAEQTQIVESQVIKEESLIKEVKKRKGVGYDKEGSGKKWLVNEYLAKKKQRNEFVVHLLKLVKNLFSVKYDDVKVNSESLNLIKESWFNEICESCLLPLLESAFKSSSLHEMAKEYELYDQYCQTLLTLATVPQLRPLLKPLPTTYKPVQLESVLSILQKQEENTKLFKKFSQVDNVKSNESEEKLHSIELANLIQATIESVKNHYPECFSDDNEDYEEISSADVDKILHLSVNEQYKLAVKDLKFDLVDMKKPNDNAYDHHYASNISSDTKVSSQTRMVRLAQEIADLTSSLPVDSYNAITVRADVNRLDVIKAMIAGAEGTPYANGLFEYHVYLPTEYPNGPPKCNLETTGSGDVRFNPNLYSCGKVCLSLLGTWRGSASENWDPKISNLLQLFLSIQSVVMSEEVYFNEPGYEGEAGTEEGEKKNEGYSNIVRLCNIKFAMIRHIKSPVKGFEEVTRRHFYIKRDVILNECSQWVKMAEVRPSSYSGLVSDHNHKYASKFSNNNKNYIADLKAAITDLENTFKELVLNNTPQSIFASKKAISGKNKAKAKKEKAKINKNGETLDLEVLREKIDTTWEEGVSNKVFDADDKKVADRWSRYIGAMGIEAVKKQAQAKVAIICMNNLGLEIAKNIILSGVNTLALCDWNTIEEGDLLGNFYATQEDIGKNRAEVVQKKLEQLNFYVKVEIYNLSNAIDQSEFSKKFDVFVICENYMKKTSSLIQEIATANKKLIIAENIGVYSRVFNDFGKEFLVNDRDGEDPSECYIKDIDHKSNRIFLFDKSQNQLRNGDYIGLDEVECKPDDENNPSLKPLNGSIHKIKEMHKITEIEVEDLSNFRTFARNGKIKELKVPIKHDFLPYSSLTEENIDKLWDENLKYHDFVKYESYNLATRCFLLKEAYEIDTGKEFSKSKFEDIKSSLSQTIKDDEKLLKKLHTFWISAHGRIHSIDAFLGGVAAQEVIKSITNKFTPIKQLLCTDFEELLDESIIKTPEIYTEEQIQTILKASGKYGPLALLIGNDSFQQLTSCRIFMVGSGAIGCELLKNYAMLGIGSGKEGRVTLTDPDSIELSNLNRQFLFREKHIGKPKSIVAASVVETMNPDYKGKIHPRLEKVCEETEGVYSDEFFSKTDICFNALDNIKARIYMDQRCLRNHVALLESGTLGSKGHVQVILPTKTENYTQVQDATDEQNIPVCTLKMFPEEPIHCVEWAKDRFEVFFSQNPKTAVRVLEEYQKLESLSEVDFKLQKSVLKFLQRRPKNMRDCIEAALKYYYKAFHNKIKQLLHVYPIDFVTKDGKLFWTLPKRPPVPLEFSLDNDLDVKFLQSYTKLLAKVWSIGDPFPGSEELKSIISKIVIEPFKPKDSATANIKEAVEKQAENDKDKVEEPQETNPEDQKKKMEEEHQLSEKLVDLIKSLEADNLIKTIKIEVFEKDVDENGHIDFIHAMTNQRTRNYKLPNMEWIQVKLKAGRIVPALATTTSAIAGLQTIEAIKIVKKLVIEQFRNAFVNLAIPTMTLSEPGPAIKAKIHEELEVTVWDQWVYEFSETSGNSLKALFDHITEKYKLIPQDLMKSNKPIFFSAIDKMENFANRTLDDLLDLDKGEYCYANIICKLKPQDEKPLQNIPQLKVHYK